MCSLFRNALDMPLMFKAHDSHIKRYWGSFAYGFPQLLMVRSCKIWNDITFLKLVELVGGPIISNVEITRLPSGVTNLRLALLTMC
jgi:hypothetical protein